MWIQNETCDLVIDSCDVERFAVVPLEESDAGWAVIAEMAGRPVAGGSTFVGSASTIAGTFRRPPVTLAKFKSAAGGFTERGAHSAARKELAGLLDRLNRA